METHITSFKGRERGFTLLELLIVIGILVILSTVVIFVLNPAETLRKSRDAQRVSDLSTIKSALGLYLTATSTPQLDGTSGNTLCENGSGTDTIYYSYPSDSPGAPITDVLLDSGTYTVVSQVTNANKSSVDGTGWIKVPLAQLIGGSPISNMPVDPTNSVTVAAVASTDLVYRYACDANDLTFEVDARLESTAYTSNPDNKHASDGGNNSGLYEVGTKLTILGTGADF